MRPKILCISFSEITADSRVLRQLDLLAEFGEVTTLSYGSKPAAAADHLEIDSGLASLPQTPLGVALLTVRWHSKAELAAPAVQRALALVKDHNFDLIVANEARALPFAHHIAGETPIWGDMHEWAPEERVQVLSWRLLVAPLMARVCKKYLPRTQAITTVNESIAVLYKENFGSPTEIVRNARPFVDLTPQPLSDSVIRLVHSGAAVPGRNLEGMIEAVQQLGTGYTLDFYLIEARDNGRYLRRIQHLAANSKRIRFHPSVSPDELPEVLNSYDLGIYSLPPQTRNQALMLPNKFFDFVQARLGIVFSPSPETSRLIQEHHVGSVTEDFSPASLAAAIRSLSRDQIWTYKQNTDRAAQALSSESDNEIVRGILRRLLLDGARPASR
ncbi:glycosyltransferase family 4 protein [Arthrobacter parietis]|uniref:Glycosyltransferase family 4 protein n=1 Tax=Arthrobacter parietis TaxID=271434 RepID=A0ABN3AUY4_9MICC